MSTNGTGIDADGRQSEAARDIARGVARCLRTLDFAVIPEVSLPTGQRVDLLAVSPRSDVWGVEIKSSVEDFHADSKWSDYRAYCDRFFFAVTPVFPNVILPAETALLLADRYGGEIVRAAPVHMLSGARRKSLLTLAAVTAAHRLWGQTDPDFIHEYGR